MTVRDKLSNRRKNDNRCSSSWQANLKILDCKGLRSLRQEGVFKHRPDGNVKLRDYCRVGDRNSKTARNRNAQRINPRTMALTTFTT